MPDINLDKRQLFPSCSTSWRRQYLAIWGIFLQVAKIYVRVKTNKEKQNIVEQSKKVDRWIRYLPSDKRTRRSSLSYPVAQNVASQDLFGGHYFESFTEPKSRTPLERLHKTTIKTEINKGREIFFFSCTSDSETYSRVFPNIILGNSYNSPRYCCSVFHRDSDRYRS